MQVQFQFSINPIDPFVVPSEAFHIAQMQETQIKALVPLVVDQLDQPVRNLGILAAELGLIAVTGLDDAEYPASQTNTDAFFTDGFLRHLTTMRQFNNFFNGFLEDVRLEPLLGVHLLESAVLVRQLLQAGHHGRIHAAELGTSLVKGRSAHAVFTTQLWDRYTVLGLFQNRQDLIVGKT